MLFGRVEVRDFRIFEGNPGMVQTTSGPATNTEAVLLASVAASM